MSLALNAFGFALAAMAEFVGVIEWQSIGAGIVTVAAILGGLSLIWKTPVISKPVRWLVRVNIADPLTKWYKRVSAENMNEQIDKQVMPLATNQAVIERKVDAIMAELTPSDNGNFRQNVNEFITRTAEDVVQLREGQMLLVEVINAKRYERRHSDWATFDTGTPGVEWDPETESIVFHSNDKQQRRTG